MFIYLFIYLFIHLFIYSLIYFLADIYIYLGVKNGMFLGEARKLCPNLKVVAYDFPLYELLSEKVCVYLSLCVVCYSVVCVYLSVCVVCFYVVCLSVRMCGMYLCGVCLSVRVCDRYEYRSVCPCVCVRISLRYELARQLVTE